MGVSEKEPVLLAIWNGDLRHGFDHSQMMMRPNFSRQTIRAAVGAGDAAAIHIGDWSQRRRADRAVRIPRTCL